MNSPDGVFGMLEAHLKSNEWMILSVGEDTACPDRDQFCVGQTLHDNQNAASELAEFGYFPAGTLFAVKRRPRRKADAGETLLFLEVKGCGLVQREMADVMDRVDWRRVSGLILDRRRWGKRMAEHRALELAFLEYLDREEQRLSAAVLTHE